jgi:hypothetical protein
MEPISIFCTLKKAMDGTSISTFIASRNKPFSRFLNGSSRDRGHVQFSGALQIPMHMPENIAGSFDDWDLQAALHRGLWNT